MINDFFEALCNWCISAMEYGSSISGLSYSAINIILFVILGPLSTLILSLSWICAKEKGIISNIFGIIGIGIAITVFIVSVYCLFNCNGF